MGANVRRWSREILGVEMTPQQFLNDPEAQDLIAGIMFTERLKRYSVEDTISLWFSGRTYAGNNRCDVNMCVPQYVRSVISLVP